MSGLTVVLSIAEARALRALLDDLTAAASVAGEGVSAPDLARSLIAPRAAALVGIREALDDALLLDDMARGGGA